MYDDLIICNVDDIHKVIVQELITELTEERRRTRVWNQNNNDEYQEDDFGPDAILVLNEKAYSIEGDLLPGKIGIEGVSEETLSEAKQEFYSRFKEKQKR